MKVLLIHNFYQFHGGEEESFLSEKKLLQNKNHKIITFVRDNKSIRNYMPIKKVTFVVNTIFSFDTYRKLRKIVTEEKPDIAHAHNIFPLISPAVYYILKRYNIPIVQTVHNYRLLCLNGLFLTNNGKICEKCKKGNFFYGILNKCYHKSYLQSFVMAITIFIHRIFLKTFSRKIDTFISPSKFLKEKLIEGKIPEEKIIVKPHFIECERIKPSYEFDNYAVYMGRLSKEKGLFTLVRAFKNIMNITLKIVGDGPIRKDLENYIDRERIKNVQFLGYINGDDRFDVLKKAMFMLFPSECYENMPYTILESFACGVPVVASRIGGLKELVIDGYNGLLFEPGNIEDLKQKIVNLLNSRELLLKMRYNARKTAEERFSEKKGYENLIEVYQKAKNPRRKI